MQDENLKIRLLTRLHADDRILWSVLDTLAAHTDEPKRRRILRPHNEAGFHLKTDAPAIQERAALDRVLEALTLCEIGRQTGLLTSSDELPASQDSLNELFNNSQAFLRYANAYLYFGIRFLAGRVAAPAWMSLDPAPKVPERGSNERPFGLVVPPQIVTSALDVTATSNWLDLLSRPENHALRFLDDFIFDDEEPQWLEHWLRGLRPETEDWLAHRFEKIASGLGDWALARCEFYLGLDPASGQSRPPATVKVEGEAIEGPVRPMGGWTIDSPLAARFGLVDIYWIARLLRADVSAHGLVSYHNHSWLCLLAEREGKSQRGHDLRRAEEVLRSVFDLTCELVQNAVEITEERERRAFQPELFTPLQPDIAFWRETFDQELDEIVAQRARRTFTDEPGPSAVRPVSERVWSKGIQTGGGPRNLVGLALSGGGIRSATFNLGVLQALQEFDLLRYIDYLSTVSGGGFIGAWLVANVKRTSYWLARLTSWDESVAHLRRYSNYLAPSTGVLSADTWTMWAIWLRNALLVQITAVMWLAALLLVGIAGESLFFSTGWKIPLFTWVPLPGILSGILSSLTTLLLLRNLGWHAEQKFSDASPARWIRRLAVVPTFISCFLTAAIFWGDATGRSALASEFRLNLYSDILKHAWMPWLSILGFSLLVFAAIAASTQYRRRWHTVWISLASVIVLYLQLCFIMWLFRQWASEPERFNWFAYVCGPTLVLAAYTVTVLFFIGFCGRNSREWIREWWTRYGTWLGIYGAGYLALSTSAVFGPLWILMLLQVHPTIKWGALAGWVGTVLGGLFAGKSSKTSGRGSNVKSPWLERLAKAAGLLFIVGGLLGVAFVLHTLLVNMGTLETVSRDCYFHVLSSIPLLYTVLSLIVALLCGSLFSWFFEINIFGLNQFYRNRLVRCYLGASRWIPGLRKPQPFTGFDGHDDLKLDTLSDNFRGPFPIINCTLNLGGSSDLTLHTRRSASFSLTPLRCGSDRRKVGYAPTCLKRTDDRPECSFADGVMLGQATAISGAAASPNMGFNTSPLVAFLLTMFNVRLGWWFPNPGKQKWDSRGLRFSLYYMIKELFGLADETNLFVNVSDGGHFENLGVYELVRRRCKVIIASDAECDESLEFTSLGNLVRVCETDFGARIDIDVNSIKRQKDASSLAHCTVGKITYSNGSIGHLLYLKASVTGDESVSVTQYRSGHPSFPHETTADQFFSEDQFEAYRLLGHHVVAYALRGNRTGAHPVSLVEKLYDVWAPAGFSNETFLTHTKKLDEIWERLRQARGLRDLLEELNGKTPRPAGPAGPTPEETCAGLELLQLMENVFLDLRLEDFWEHPDNRGWVMMFMRWARSARLRAVWLQNRRLYGIRFEYFCEERMGMPRESPIARV